MHGLFDDLVLPLFFGLPFALILGGIMIRPIRGISGPARGRAEAEQVRSWVGSMFFYGCAASGIAAGVRVAELVRERYDVPRGAVTLGTGVLAIAVLLLARWVARGQVRVQAIYGLLAFGLVPGEWLVTLRPPVLALVCALLVVGVVAARLTHVVPAAPGERVGTAKDDPARTDCPACGYPFLEEPARCVHCRVPHHADCFEYAGRCRTDGCHGLWLWTREARALERAAREKEPAVWVLRGVSERESSLVSWLMLPVLVEVLAVVIRGADIGTMILHAIAGAVVVFGLSKLLLDDYLVLDARERTIVEHHRWLREVSREPVATFDDRTVIGARRGGSRCGRCGKESWYYGFTLHLPGRVLKLGAATLWRGWRWEGEEQAIARTLSTLFGVEVSLETPSEPFRSDCFRRCWGERPGPDHVARRRTPGYSHRGGAHDSAAHVEGTRRGARCAGRPITGAHSRRPWAMPSPGGSRSPPGRWTASPGASARRARSSGPARRAASAFPRTRISSPSTPASSCPPPTRSSCAPSAPRRPCG